MAEHIGGELPEGTTVSDVVQQEIRRLVDDPSMKVSATQLMILHPESQRSLVCTVFFTLSKTATMVIWEALGKVEGEGKVEAAAT